MSNKHVSEDLRQQLISDDCKTFSVKNGDEWKEFVAIVRCKNCKYLQEDECPWTGVIDWNGYCSRGEKRKESGQNA